MLIILAYWVSDCYCTKKYKNRPLFITGMEIVGPSKRLWAGIVIEYFFALGLVLLCLVGYLVRQWKYNEIVLSVPSAIILVYWWWVSCADPENLKFAGGTPPPMTPPPPPLDPRMNLYIYIVTFFFLLHVYLIFLRQRVLCTKINQESIQI